MRALQDQLPDAEVVLFGSWAVGTGHPWSDLDLAVIGVEPDRAQETGVWDSGPHGRPGRVHPSARRADFSLRPIRIKGVSNFPAPHHWSGTALGPLRVGRLSPNHALGQPVAD